MKRKKAAPLTLALLLFSYIAFTQENNSSNFGEIHGNFQADAQYYNPDSTIGAPPIPEKLLSNGFCNLNFRKGNFSAGLRYESYLNVMNGFDSRYKGTGIPYRFATYTNDYLEVTVGGFYEQFGSGMPLRIYEERGLGFDNMLEGMRLRAKPYKGFYLKALIGKQRFFFNQGPGIVRGFDGEWNLNETFSKLEDKKTQVILGGCFVSKYQADQNPNLILPQNVGLSSGRINLSRGKVNLFTEYCYKINDPNYDNLFSYKFGQSLLLQASYSQKGLAFSTGIKWVDNMGYKSDRDVSGNVLFINFNPVLTKQHTYGLLAFYPYANQNNGEFCYQADFTYKFKKETPLGGKYGMDISINYSASFSPDTMRLGLSDSTQLLGYKVKFGDVNWSNAYFEDLNIEISKKLSPKFKFTLIYSYQNYNVKVIEGYDNHNVYSHIGVFDLTYKYKDEHSIRVELQHLLTDEHSGNKSSSGSWAHGLVEWICGEHFFVAFQDQYNYGHYDESKRYHFYVGNVGYIKGTNRVTLGYGKQRAGIFCVGGVCRFVPASNGITLSITSSF